MMVHTEYFRNNYGSCRLGDSCKCVRNLGDWLGVICSQWEPTKATNFEELAQEARKKREQDKLKRSV